jgi:murein DD-endopeptidase MepM/ murein hydrolase activator NlpD
LDQKVKFTLVFLLVLLIALPILLLVLSTGTQIAVTPAVSVIGIDTPVRVILTNPHGVRKVQASIEQNNNKSTVLLQTTTAHRFLFARYRTPPRNLIVNFGTKEAPALKDGKAKLIVQTTANDFRGKEDSTSWDVDVITTPPHVSADGEEHQINQGGSELVVFTPTGYWTDAGVEVGMGRYRSYPLPSAPDRQRFSLFAYPWDTPVTTTPRVYATNAAGTMAYAAFRTKIKPKPFRSRELKIDDNFLNRVVNQIEPGGSGDLWERFLRINRDLRKKNNQTLADLRLQSAPRMLWSGAFLPLVNSAVESYFADRRTYIYKGRKVDEQVHLGFDLAKVAHTPIPAANDGKVLWASDLGIYGNCVVLDHGYGLQTIYGHMSEFSVKVGDMVKKGQTLGKSGSTGLAGGDHLHFSMQVDGVQVNPVEWWDAHWIHDRILSKLK